MAEHCLYTADVAGSIPVPPTIILFGIRAAHSDILTSPHQHQLPPWKSLVGCFPRTIFLRGRRSARLGRQIVNLEVAGSNPVGPAIPSRVDLFCSEFTFPRVPSDKVNGGVKIRYALFQSC